MNDSKLITLLGSFSKDELKQFEKFISSPFFTSGLKVSPKAIMSFFVIIKNNYPDFKSRNFTKEIVYDKLYPGVKYKDENLRVLMSVMLSLVEQFLTYNEFRHDAFENKKYLLYVLIKKDNSRLFKYHQKQAQRLAESGPVGPNYYYRKFGLSIITHKYSTSGKGLLEKDNFQEMEDNFFYFALSKSIDIHSMLLNEKNVFNKNYKLNFYNEIVTHLKKTNYDDNPSLAIVINKLLLTSTENVRYYRGLLRLKDKYKSNMEPQLLYDIMTDLINYCIKQTKKGNKRFRNEEFKLNKEFAEEKMYAVNEHIRDIPFLNMASTACILKEFEWAENFIKNYGPLLDPGLRKETCAFAMGVLNYNRKKYDEALRDFSKIQVEYSHLKFSVKNFLLLIYYETSAWESAFSLIDSYRHFLANEKYVSGYIKKSNLNFLKYYSELIKLKTGGETIKTRELKRKLSASEHCVHKQWLMEKAEKLDR